MCVSRRRMTSTYLFMASFVQKSHVCFKIAEMFNLRLSNLNNDDQDDLEDVDRSSISVDNF